MEWNLQQRIDQLEPRERQLLLILVIVFFAMLLVLIPAFISLWLGAKQDDNEQLRLAIDRIIAERSIIEKRKAENEAVLRRYQQETPPLAGLLDRFAKSSSLAIPEIKDRPAVPRGKKYEERSTSISLKRVGMFNLSKFLEKIAQSAYPLSVTKLTIRKRGSAPDSYDVNMYVSAYHRLEKKKGAQQGGEK